MQIFNQMEQLAALPAPVYWAMGFFDGVHLGHRRVIAAAQSPGTLRGVLTFDRHPLALLRPAQAPALLTPDAQYKADLIERIGRADILLRLPFTAELADTPPEEFLSTLGRYCRIAGISVGSNWRFGRGGGGTPELLQRLGKQNAFAVNIQELAEEGGEPVSSSRVRSELAAGCLAAVEQLLGRPFAIIGTVEHGQKLARQLGFPTANIRPNPGAALPPYGVYRVRCMVGGIARAGIANLGLRPTIQEQEKTPRLEIHLPGWQGNLYGQRLTVELLEHLRPERRFSTVEALKQQMERDIAAIS